MNNGMAKLFYCDMLLYILFYCGRLFCILFFYWFGKPIAKLLLFEGSQRYGGLCSVCVWGYWREKKIGRVFGIKYINGKS
ncbi:hypothetical protein BCR42DRAFT_413944 [Absidia repens]|uniref:Uncharacterized protein n=1 Tax=Absidia repens TaxID=90262 RepID=A0A1X2IIH5_9FUNG|nr:hypothetical protein BCR42DRAFT_413944 [Absidia repens]